MCFAPTQIPGVIGQMKRHRLERREKERKKENDTLSNKQLTWVENVTLNSTEKLFNLLTLFLD